MVRVCDSLLRTLRNSHRVMGICTYLDDFSRLVLEGENSLFVYDNTKCTLMFFKQNVDRATFSHATCIYLGLC